MIASLLELGGDRVERADVCVIGSGGGGAVAAAELAAAGLDVVVLEQGHHWTAKDFTQREDEMLPRLFEEAGMRATRDGSVAILQGRNVGGSTVHNLCYAFRTPDPILRMWREERGLTSLTPEALAPSFARVEKNLRVKPIREEEINTLNRIVRRGAESLGYSGFVTQHNREGCVQAGYCILGCSYDAKQSMLVTYVPRASAAGARIYADARCDRIEAEGGRVRRVLGSAVGPDGTPHGTIEVSARTVVLAAGAVATPDLLQRSGLGGDGVGRHLHLHPTVMAAGFFDEELHAYRGIPQSYYIDQFIDLERDPHRGYVLMPIAGFPVLTATQMPGFGRDHFAVMRDFSRMAGLLVLLHDRSAGRVRPGDSLSRPRIDYTLSPDDGQQLAEGLIHCAEVLFAGGARRVVIPFQPEALVLQRGDDLTEITRRGVRHGEIAMASTHPQSTCRMGATASQGVVNPFGEVFGVRGLFVADMSVFPTSLGAPPQITTAALADRTAHHILARWPELSRVSGEHPDLETASHEAEGGITLGVWELAWPTMLSFALQTAVGFVDFVIVASLGTEAVAAVGVAHQFYFAVFALLAAVTTGTVALVARFIGAGDEREADRVLRLSAALGVVLGAALMGMIPWCDDVVSLFGVEPEVVGLGGSYLRILMYFNIPFTFGVVVSMGVRGAGDVRTPLLIGVVLNVVNVILNYGLVYGRLGMPELGTDGSALGTGIAMSVGGLIWLELWRRNHLVIRRNGWLDGFTRDRARRIVRIGIPTALEQIAFQVGLLLFLRVVARFGTDPVSAYLIGVRILAFSFVPGIGYAQAGSTLVGQHLGAGDPDGAARSGWRATGGAMVVMGSVGLLIILTAPWIARIFGAAGQNTVDLTVIFIYILGAVQPLMAMEFALGGSLRGAGDTRFPLFVILTGLFGVRLVSAHIVAGVFGGSVVAVWCCLLADYAVKAAMLSLRFASGAWKRVHV